MSMYDMFKLYLFTNSRSTQRSYKNISALLVVHYVWGSDNTIEYKELRYRDNPRLSSTDNWICRVYEDGYCVINTNIIYHIHFRTRHIFNTVLTELYNCVERTSLINGQEVRIYKRNTTHRREVVRSNSSTSFGEILHHKYGQNLV